MGEFEKCDSLDQTFKNDGIDYSIGLVMISIYVADFVFQIRIITLRGEVIA